MADSISNDRDSEGDFKPLFSPNSDPDVAFNHILEKYGHDIERLCKRCCKSDWEDAAQDSLIRIFTKIYKIPAKNSLPWLKRLTINVCITRIRKSHPERSNELKEHYAAYNIIDETDSNITINVFLGGLDETDRGILLLASMKANKAEIAKQLSIPESVVRYRLKRMRDQAAARLTGGAEAAESIESEKRIERAARLMANLV